MAMVGTGMKARTQQDIVPKAKVLAWGFTWEGFANFSVSGSPTRDRG